MRTPRGVGGVLSLLTLLVATANPVAAAGEVTPRIVTGTTNDVRYVGDWSTPSTIAQFLVPPGTWAVTAQATLRNVVGGPRSTRCELRTTGTLDTSWVSLRGGAWGPILLHVVLKVTSTGGTPVRFRCAARTGFSAEVEAHWIRLNAIEVGRLRTVNLVTGAGSTSGSGSPRAVRGSLAGPIDVPAPAPVTVASMPLPAGLWVLLGKAVAINTHNRETRAVVCTVTPGHDESRTTVGHSSSRLDRGMLAWQAYVALVGSPGAVDVDCQADEPGIQITNLRLTAIQVPSAFNKHLPTTVTSTRPAHIYWHDDVRLAKRTWAEQQLPNGHWAAFVTAELFDPFDDAGGAVSCVLDLPSYGDEGVSVAKLSKVGTPGSEFAFTMLGAFTIDTGLPEARFVRVTCIGATGEGAYMGGRVAFLRFVLLEGAALSEQSV